MTGQGTGEAARTHQPVNEQGTGEAARAHHGVNEQAPRAPLRPYGRWLGPKRVALILLLGFLIRLPFIGSDTGITNDTRTFVAWAHAIRAQGVTNAYVRTGIDYPPFSLYLLAGAERLEARLPDDLRRGDRALIALTKLPAVLADLVLAGLVMGAVRRRREALPVWLTLAGLLYVLHPAVWYVSAYWGQTDSVYTLFVVMAVMAIARGAVVPAWLVYTLALASKLQAIAIAPVLVVWTVTRHGVRGLALGLAAAGAAAAILLAPWLRAGNIGDVLTTLY
ncbi:MAG: hypothetical protein HY259_00580, partial [Chloroflexi bacterium]|nr:hypothetical protein [Chloroflexota bacterium]